MAIKGHDTVADTLENLIEQFTNPFAFYRELIQNSLDAGTNRVDIHLEYIPPEEKGKQGVMIIHVDDYGEGMNRNIIDNQLTRLFSSSKENDLSKIGKFGIGFVSVFAIKPDGVNIDTSKDGEDWRILFNGDKTFNRFKRDYPVDGTKIKIIKACSREYHSHALTESEKTIRFWCRHSEADIYFNDQLINEPFDLNLPVKIHIREDAGEIVAGFTHESPPFFGYYNQGLTLMEGYKSYYSGIAYKIKSKYLEHTMTRDNIREDEHYWKAMNLLEEIVEKRLPSSIFKSIEEELLSDENETPRYQQLISHITPYIIKSEKSLPKECLVYRIARSTEGEYLSVSDIMAMTRTGEIYYDAEPNPVTALLSKKKGPVIKTEQSSELLNTLHEIMRALHSKIKIYKVTDHFFITRPIDHKKLDREQKDLIHAVDYINRKMSVKTSSLRFADFDYKDSSIKHRVYVMQDEPGGLSQLSDLDSKKMKTASLFSLFSRTRTLVINNNHDYIKGLIKLALRDREMAAYLLSKLLYIDDGIDTETDAKLMAVSLERRGL